MSMRDCYTRPGAKIHYFLIEWDKTEQSLTWADFRGQVLGATDPEVCAPTSLRGMVKAKWRELGLQGPPTVRDNGVHASASPFEALAERCNWLQTDPATDPYSIALANAGVSLDMQKEWMQDPQVKFEGKNSSLFDTVEDMDSWALLGRAARIAGAEEPPADAKASCPKNMAFVFVKPHATVGGGTVEALVKETFEARGIKIVGEGEIDSKTIDEKKLVDLHYGAIASKAAVLKPDQLHPSSKAKEQFGTEFGLAWETAVEKGMVLNAVDSCKKLGIDGDAMEKMWNVSKKNGKLVKFGGGFYCAQIDMDAAKPPKLPTYAINGFYMGMRDCYTKAGAQIHWFDVEFDQGKLAWADFRARVLGATDPDGAAPDSLRGQIKADWQKLGLPDVPSVRDNGVHASASPFEAMCERANWLERDMEGDPFSKALAEAGVPLATQLQWVQDPQVPFEGKNQSLFDLLEDMDAWELLGRAAAVLGADAPAESLKAGCPKNRAVVFVKPHAITPSRSVETLVNEKFNAEGITILAQGTISNQAIEEKKLIDKHYGAIAAKAAILKPAETNPTQKARETFAMTFGLSWEEALSKGQVLNAVDACKHLSIDGDKMGDLWNNAKKDGKLIKFGGGFYCAQVD
jgi:nucleoside diphosphate kinase